MSSHPSLCSDQCRPGHHIHICQLSSCGRQFQSKKSNALYCSRSHATRAAALALPERACAWPGCPNKAMPGLKDGYCQSHHRRSVEGKEMDSPLRRPNEGECEFTGEQTGNCGRPQYAKGLCRVHYERSLQGREMDAPIRRSWQMGESLVGQCTVEDETGRCPRRVNARGMCNTHYLRWQKTGGSGPVALLRKAAGEGHLNDRGYVEIQVGGVKRHQHLWVADEMIGVRVDTSKFEVHHKNGIRNDNRPENLEIVPIGHGAGQHFEDLVPFIVEHSLDELYRRDGHCENFPSWARKSAS